MKYLLATCGADQHCSKENTDSGNFLKQAFYTSEAGATLPCQYKAWIGFMMHFIENYSCIMKPQQQGCSCYPRWGSGAHRDAGCCACPRLHRLCSTQSCVLCSAGLCPTWTCTQTCSLRRRMHQRLLSATAMTGAVLGKGKPWFQEHNLN